jgi:hypothetical protein
LRATAYLLLSVAVIGHGWYSNAKQNRTAHEVLEADMPAVPRIEDRVD